MAKKNCKKKKANSGLALGPGPQGLVDFSKIDPEILKMLEEGKGVTGPEGYGTDYLKAVQPSAAPAPAGYDQALRAILQKQLQGTLGPKQLAPEEIKPYSHLDEERAKGILPSKQVSDIALPAVGYEEVGAQAKKKGVPYAALMGGLQLADYVVAEDPTRNPVVRPGMVYNDKPQGRGSQAIYDDGGVVDGGGDPKPKKKAYDWAGEMKTFTQKYKLDGQNPIQLAQGAAKTTGVDPAMLYSSAYVEGLNKQMQKGMYSGAYDNALEGYYTDSTGKKRLGNQPKISEKDYPVDGFGAYGLDTFGGRFEEFVKKGYLPKEFKDQFIPYTATNEHNQQVQSAAFKNNQAALTAKAAYLRAIQDDVDGYFKKNKVQLDPRHRAYLTMATYNGTTKSSRGLWAEYLAAKDKNAFIDQGQTKYQQLHQNVYPRLQLMNTYGELAKLEDGGTLTDGGELQVGAEGAVKPISYNPYSGETVEFKGPSHEEGGIDMAFGGNQVEVEGDETAFKDREGNLQILGNMVVPGHKKKFKNVLKDIAKEEMKAKKQLDLATQLMDNTVSKGRSTARNSAELMAKGADVKLKHLAQNKESLAQLQSAILAHADKVGMDPNDVASGKTKAKWGASVQFNDGGKVPPRKDLEALADKIAAARGIDPKVFRRLIFQESGFNPKAVSNTGAMGVVQFMEATAKSYGLTKKQLQSTDIKDIEKVMDAGARHLGSLVKKYKDPKLALAAYNGGDAAINFVKKELGKKSITGDEWVAFMEKRQKDKPTKKTSAWQTQTLDYVNTILGTDDTTFYGDDKTPGAGTKYRQRYYAIPDATLPGTGTSTVGTTSETTLIPPAPKKAPMGTTPSQTWDRAFDFELPQGRQKTSNVEDLGLSQIAPELVAQAKNKVEPVWLQQLAPEYYQPYQVTMQDQVNENNAAFRGLEQQVGNDPASLAVLAAQKYGANSKVLADQFRTNQGIEAEVINKNTALFNETQYKNLALGDQQYVRQETAKSKTKAQDHEILSSVAAKSLQHDASMQKLALYENLYNYRFQDTDGDGIEESAVNQNAAPVFNFDMTGAPVKDPTVKNTETVKIDANGRVIATTKQKEDNVPRTTVRKTNKNGGSVTSLYNQMLKKMR